MKILIVGGTWGDKARPSGLINHLGEAISHYSDDVTIHNGGDLGLLKHVLDTCAGYDYIFWFANVDNSEPKYRDVKAVNPRCMLITSKRNDEVNGHRKYDMEELLQRALDAKANLCFEFSKEEGGYHFNIRIFDPLGCVWYDGISINEAVDRCMNRLDFISKVTRKPSIQVPGDPEFEFNETDKEFLDFVRASGETFHKLMCLPPDVKRFVGNASLRFNKPTRCMNGFPAIRKSDILVISKENVEVKKNDVILISRRNVDKTGITEKDFVPCCLKGEDTLYMGNNKPSVDTPVQLRLFRELQNIDYILHGHCYIKHAPCTDRAIPCGAIEEVGEVFKTIKNNSGDFYAVNLLGHGCLIMAGANRLNDMKQVEFIVRPMPEGGM